MQGLNPLAVATASMRNDCSSTAGVLRIAAAGAYQDKLMKGTAKRGESGEATQEGKFRRL